jgi:Uri superfamily endonuclease
MNCGLCDTIRGGNRIDLIRTYAYIFLMKGTYLLIMKLHKGTSIMIRKHGVIQFQKGYYVYVGSALNNLHQRIQRHLRTNKRIHWHLDYLLLFTEIVDIFYKENIRREECKIAQVLNRCFKNIPGFGCSDCVCTSHLFHGSYHDILRLIESLNMNLYPLHTNP